MKSSRVASFHALVGTMSDAEVARRVGVTPDAVRRWRNRWGLPPGLPALEAAASIPRVRTHGRRPSSWIRSTTRWSIYARDLGTCVWCGHVDACESLDHIWPVGRAVHDAMLHHPRWLVTCCLSCNCARKQLRVATWLRRLRADGVDLSEVLKRLNRRRLPLSAKAGQDLRAALMARYAPHVHSEEELQEAGLMLGADGQLY